VYFQGRDGNFIARTSALAPCFALANSAGKVLGAGFGEGTAIKRRSNRQKGNVMAYLRTIGTLLSSIAIALGNATVISAQTPRAHDPTKPETLVLALLPEGFAAREINLSAGLYLIDIINRSTVRTLRFEIDKMPGTSLTDTQAAHTAEGHDEPQKPRFLTLVQLTAGTYRIQVTGHPTWICGITVR
jgi:hypothetical protein